IEEPWRVTEKGAFLLQVDVDAAEKNPLLADIRLVSADGCVGGNEQGIVPQVGQRCHQGIVVHTAATVHAGCARGDGGDLHSVKPKFVPRTPSSIALALL